MLQGPGARPVPRARAVGHVREPAEGQDRTVTSSARTVKGNRAVFAVLDQTEVGPGRRWAKLASTMRINAAKVGGSTIESPNAFIPVRSRWRRSPQRSGRRSVRARRRTTASTTTIGKRRRETDMADRGRYSPASVRVRRLGGIEGRSRRPRRDHRDDLGSVDGATGGPCRLPEPDHPRLGRPGDADRLGGLPGCPG